MADEAKLTAILDTLSILQDQRVNQKHGCLYQHNMSGQPLIKECGSCIGAWMAYALNTPLRTRSEHLFSYWWFEDGIDAFAEVIGESQSVILDALIRHGAPMVPFGQEPWGRDPYLVIRDTCAALIDFHHEEYLDPAPAQRTLVPV